ncbi:RHS repeat-associated core domain-containing protein [Pseudomonas sp. NY15463]|uniref:RHS repeat-associated core domain-containing protein n=1 Tax=Pseudomonas sp. NY15463 TaxID=3400361 RepID=UPI003A88EE4C
MTSVLLATDIQRSVIRFGTGTPRAYLPYGLSRLDGGPMSAFCGERRDDLTGCYHLGNGYRQFNPVIMRFHQADAMSPFGKGGFNGYGYCGADPINRLDSNGHFWSQVVQAVGIISSTATTSGSIIRTARNVISRINQGAATFPDPHISTRLGNTQYLISGTSGMARGIQSGVENGWGSSNLASPVTWIGVANQVTNVSGALSSNFLAARDVYRFLRSNPGQTGRVLRETVLELSFADEGLSAVVRGGVWAMNTAGQIAVDAGNGLLRMGATTRAYFQRRWQQADPQEAARTVRETGV